jgi:hypothetical protein
MKLDRFRAPALAATAVLLISGAANALAANPPTTVTEPISQVTQVEPVGPDTDTLQEGDQTTPDVAGAEESTAESAEAPEAASAEADGPGGHADANDADVDHQFDGQE